MEGPSLQRRNTIINIEEMKSQKQVSEYLEYRKNIDLNQLFNLTYSFDPLRTAIDTLFK